jgi:hypothetical protein
MQVANVSISKSSALASSTFSQGVFVRVIALSVVIAPDKVRPGLWGQRFFHHRG